MAATGDSVPGDAAREGDAAGEGKAKEAEAAVAVGVASAGKGGGGSGDTPSPVVTLTPLPSDVVASPVSPGTPGSPEAVTPDDAAAKTTLSLTMGTARETLSEDTDCANSEVFDTDAWESTGGSPSACQSVSAKHSVSQSGPVVNDAAYEPLAELERELQQTTNATSWTSISSTECDESSIGWDSSVAPTASSSSTSGLSPSTSSSSSSTSSGPGWRCNCALCRRKMTGLRVMGLRLMSKRSRRLYRVLLGRHRRRRHRPLGRLGRIVANYSYNIWHWRSDSVHSDSSNGLSGGHSPSAVQFAVEGPQDDQTAAPAPAPALALAPAPVELDNAVAAV